MPTRWLPALTVAVLMVSGLAGCGGGHAQKPREMAPASPAAPAPGSWVEDAVTFPVGDMTVYGTFRHQSGQGQPMPAALLIAGSGPTDRNGNSAVMRGQIGTLQNLAQALSKDGVASLRYDKLGTGQTGLGPYGKDPASIDVAAFQNEANAALTFLAGQPGVDRNRLMVVGHSEGALYALQLATAAPGTAPPVHALGLVEPQSRRILDHVSLQTRAQVDAAVKAGKMTAEEATENMAAIDKAIADFRATGTASPDEPPGLKPIINPANARFLKQEDAIDPAELAAKLARDMPVLVSCSDADTQITCEDTDHLVSGLTTAGTKTDYVHLTGVNHVLKEDDSKTAAGYTKPRPFSNQLTTALAAFVKENLS
jgi:uncharacterized protein